MEELASYFLDTRRISKKNDEIPKLHQMTQLNEWRPKASSDGVFEDLSLVRRGALPDLLNSVGRSESQRTDHVSLGFWSTTY